LAVDRDTLLFEVLVARSKGHSDVLEEKVKNLLEHFPRDVTGRVTLSSIMEGRGHIQEAVHLLEAELELQPTSSELLKNLGNLMLRIGQGERASELYFRILGSRPRDAEASFGLASYMFDACQYGEAFERLKVAIESSPRTAEYHELMGRVLIELGRDETAAQAFQNAIGLKPTWAKPKIELAKLLMAHGQEREAPPYLLEALACDPQNAGAHMLLAQCYITTEKFDQGESSLKEAIEINPGLTEAHTMLGYRLQTRGQFEEARAAFEKASQGGRGPVMALYGLVQGRRISDEDMPLVKQLEDRLAEENTDPGDLMSLRYALGKAYEDMGRFERATEEYVAANKLAFVECLGGRPFRRQDYSTVLDRNIETFSRNIETFFKEMPKSSPRANDSTSDPIFVVGMMRSGTTLLEQILSSHPDIFGGGEMNFWLDHSNAAVDYDKKKVNMERLAKLRKDYLEEISSVSGSSRFVVDKMPQNFQILGLLHVAFPNSRILHLRRDPRDNILSIFTTPYQISPEYAHDLGSIRFAYDEYLRVMAHWRKVLPSKIFLEIDYEDLVFNRKNVLQSICDILKIEWDESLLNHQNNARVVNTPSLWQVRQPMYFSSIGRWKRFASLFD
jgi:tetratricopeptide (TPR) repeat protein